MPHLRFHHLRPWIGWLAVAVFGAWVLNLVWWGLLSPESRAESTVEIVIPDGTAAAIASGTGFPFVPQGLSVAAGGTLKVWNQDSASHVIGTFEIPAGARAEIAVPADDSAAFICTIHPSGSLSMNLTRRPPIWSTVLPTLLLGVPLGLLTGVVTRIAGRLGQWSVVGSQ